jgi:hypothetical protein
MFFAPFSQHWHLLTSPRRTSSSSLIISAPAHLIVTLQAIPVLELDCQVTLYCLEVGLSAASLSIWHLLTRYKGMVSHFAFAMAFVVCHSFVLVFFE